MKLPIVRNIAFSWALIGLLSGCNSGKAPAAATAPAAQAPPAAATTPEPATPAPATEAEPTPVPVPETLEGIWQAIDSKNAELKITVESGSLDDVHHQAFALRDLVAALPAKSSSLSADEQAKLGSEVKFVATLAARLDEAGDAGDRAAAQADYGKLAAVLNGITRTK